MPKLIPYRDGNNWGYSDTNGNIVITPQWERVSFFTEQGTAVVEFIGKHLDGEQARVACVIDTLGNYIISPDHNVAFFVRGIEDAKLNAHDSHGYGMVDTNGRVMIPFLYDRMPYEVSRYYEAWNKWYYMLRNNGNWGITDTNGRQIVPFQYAMIDTLSANGVPYFTVQVYNRKCDCMLSGLVDILGNLRIAPRYKNIRYSYSASGGFFIVQDTNFKTSVITPSSFKTIYTSTKHSITGLIHKNGLIASIENGSDRSFYGVVDMNDKVILPFVYSHIYLYHDTIWAHKHNTDAWTSDADLFTKDFKFITRISIDIPVIEAPTSSVNHISADEINLVPTRLPAPCIQKGTDCINHFIKDGITWQVDQYANRSKQYFSVRNLADNPAFHSAVVDSTMNYIIPPVAGYYIHIYHPQSGIMLVEDAVSGVMKVVDTNWKTMSAYCGGMPVIDVLKWKDKIYYMVDSGQYHTYMVKESGSTPSKFRGYKFVGITDSFGVYKRGFRYAHGGSVLDDFTGYFMVKNTKGHYGFITAEGNIIHPALSFKSGELEGMGYGFFNINDTSTKAHHFVDYNKQALLKTQYSKGSTVTRSFGINSDYGTSVPGLFRVEYRDVDFRWQHVYIDKHGRIYGKNMSFLP